MEKPVTIVREELKNTIRNAVNKSGLPAFVVADMMEAFLTELRILEKRQYDEDLAHYQNQKAGDE